MYTAPTAIRSFMKWGSEHPDRHDLTSLRLLGSVGEPINPQAWMWYHEHIGGGRCPIVDTWWQTEAGAIMITPLPGLTAAKPGSAMAPFPAIKAMVVDEQGTITRPANIVFTDDLPKTRTTMVLDALEMARWSRGTTLEGLVCHSDAGSQ
jgi:acyl-coenzyme A synthetase/AMP-(fatty) acid ligase